MTQEELVAALLAAIEADRVMLFHDGMVADPDGEYVEVEDVIAALRRVMSEGLQA